MERIYGASRALKLAVRLLSVCLILLVPGLVPAAPSDTADAEPPHPPNARVLDLAWMSGTWRGPLGEQVLEETWSLPTAGSMAGLIKITANGRTSIVELALIEDTDDSLMLRVRQWLPGFVAISDEPLTMQLVALGEREVRFEAIGNGALKSLSYSRPSSGSFHVRAEPAEGAPFEIHLTTVGD